MRVCTSFQSVLQRPYSGRCTLLDIPQFSFYHYDGDREKHMALLTPTCALWYPLCMEFAFTWVSFSFTCPYSGWIVTLVPKSLPCTLQSLAGPEILYRAWHVHEIHNFTSGFSVDYSEFRTVFLLFYQNSVGFLQTNFTSNLLCTYSEKLEGASSRER